MPESRTLAERSVDLATISIAAVGKRFQCTIIEARSGSTEDRPPRRYRGRTLDDLVAIVLSEERRTAQNYGPLGDAFLQAIREAIYDAQDKLDDAPSLSVS